MSRFELFDPDRRNENRPAHQVLLALAIALMFVTFGTTSFAAISEHSSHASDNVLTAIGLVVGSLTAFYIVYLRFGRDG